MKFELSVDVTYKCPFSCPFCSSPDNNLLPDMNLDIVRKCLRFSHEIYNQKTDQIMIAITGGEPLTLDELPLFISTWSTQSNIVNLCTTAALDVEKGYWRNLRSCGLQTVRLSLHSISEENCHAIFGRGYSFSTVNRNIEQIMSAGITLDVNFLVSRLSASNFDKVLDYCFKKDIRKVRVLGLCRQGRAAANWQRISMFQQEEASLVEHISELSDRYGIVVEFAGLPNHKWCTHSNEDGKCLGGITFFHINTIGDVYACPSVKSIATKKIGTVLHSKILLGKKTAFPCLLKLQKDSYVEEQLCHQVDEKG